MTDTFALTIVSIFVVTFIAAFIKGRARDKCLKNFYNNIVTLEEINGKIINGKLRIEHTGLELVYSEAYKDKKGKDKSSYILYKNEYPNIQAIIRFHDDLDEYSKKKREKELKRTYHPSTLRIVKRKVQNLFKTVKDSVMEVLNIAIGQAKKTSSGGAILSSQDKYVSQLKQELMGSFGNSFEPLIERHIGKRVVIELKKGDKIFEYTGVFKDYTAEFIEVMDVDYKLKEDKSTMKADLVLPRKCAIIRYLGE
jgi:small nuclear ribonucleoprotein (snRNP)-like protein